MVEFAPGTEVGGFVAPVGGGAVVLVGGAAVVPVGGAVVVLVGGAAPAGARCATAALAQQTAAESKRILRDIAILQT